MSCESNGLSGDDLGTAIMIGHVDGVETVSDIGSERLGGRIELEGPAVPLLIGHLPKAGRDPGDRQVRG